MSTARDKRKDDFLLTSIRFLFIYLFVPHRQEIYFLFVFSTHFRDDDGDGTRPPVFHLLCASEMLR